MKKAIVTGATGFIGGHLVKELLDNHYEVFAVVRPNSSKLYRLQQSDKLHIVELDLKNISDLGNKKLDESIKNGETGFLEIKSDNIEQFVSYMPMELENWGIAFFISEDVVFASANEMHNLMKLFLFGIAIGFILYILWMLWSNRN